MIPKIYLEAALAKGKYNTRRHFLRKCMSGVGALALHQLLPAPTLGDEDRRAFNSLTHHFAPKAKSVIYLHMAGAPSQLELFDYKPLLERLDGQKCPESLLEGKRFAFIRGIPSMLGPQSQFKQHGQSGTWVSDYLPHFSTLVDDVCMIKSMYTDEFNHAPATFFMHSGSPRTGRPSFGSWVTYGLGSDNANLPGFIVLLSRGGTTAGKRAWGSGFLPTVHQGVQCHTKDEPVLNLENPKGISRDLRKMSIETINSVNALEYEEVKDPEILTRISQYELAFKMQTSVPEVMNIGDEPQYVQDMYGATPGQNSFANNCLLARRLVEKGVRFVQLYDGGWDTHGANPNNGVGSALRRTCSYVDKAMTALVTDLKQRGMLDETLVIWGGEFGRTPMMEARSGKGYQGRDHNNEAFTVWMAGGGIKPGITYGETDEIGFSGVRDRVHVHDFQATILHQLGLDHERLTFRFQGRDYRLTDVHGTVVKDILA